MSVVQTLSAPGENAGQPQLGVDSNGNAVFVWQRFDGTDRANDCCYRVETRARSAGGALSAVQTLSAAGQHARDPQVGVDSNGNAVFLWDRRDATTQCSDDFGNPSGCLRVQARARSAAGALSAVQTLSDAGKDAEFQQIGVDSAGNAVFVWDRRDGTTQCDGSGCRRIQTRARSAAGALSAVQTLSDPGESAGQPQVGVDSNGNAIFVWDRRDATTQCSDDFGNPSGCLRVQARARSAAGVLSAIQTLSDAGEDAEFPQLGVNAGGEVVFVWDRFDGITTSQCDEFGRRTPGCRRVQVRTRSAAGTLSAVQTLSAAGQHAHDPQVGVDSNGNAVFVWDRRDATTQCSDDFGNPSGCLRVQGRARSATGALSAVQTLSASGRPARAPAISADPDGGLDPNLADALAAWSRFDGSHLRIQAAAQIATAGADSTPPTFAGLESATTCIPGPIGGGASSSYHLSWSAASDDVTPSSKIVYDVYQATKTGGEDFSAPTYTTAPGATSFSTPPLSADKSYYFVVRARDEAGNRDSNMVERVGQNLCV